MTSVMEWLLGETWTQSSTDLAKSASQTQISGRVKLEILSLPKTVGPTTLTISANVTSFSAGSEGMSAL